MNLNRGVARFAFAFIFLPCVVLSLSLQARALTESQRRETCDNLNYLSRASTPTAVGEILCMPFWPNGRSQFWTSTGDQVANAQNYHTSTYTHPTRAQRLAQGYSVIASGPQSEREIVSHVNRLEREIRQMAGLCCGGDRECTNIMLGGLAEAQYLSRALRFTFCHSPASYSPDSPDECASVGALYRSGLFGRADQIRLRNSELPLAGRIEFSPYVPNEGGYGDLSLLATHELTHACSSIKRQILMRQGNVQAHRTFFVDAMSAANRANTFSVYQNIFSNFQLSEGLQRCIFDLSSLEEFIGDTALNPNMLSRIEEGYAIAIGHLYSRGLLTPVVFPSRTCNIAPSPIHPNEIHVMNCLVRHEPRFYARLRGELQCRP